MVISLVVPVYNEASNIEKLVGELDSVADKIEQFEAILVDDGSHDGSWELLNALCSKREFLRGIHLPQNKGQSCAILQGLHAATGDVMATMDGDLQNDPADIPSMIEALLPDVDCVCGYRAKRQDSWSRKMGSRLANAVRNAVTKDEVRDTGCSLKVFRRGCINDLPLLDGVHRFMPAYFSLNHRRIVEIPVNHRRRVNGTSKYTNLSRLPKTILDLAGFWWYRKRYIGRVEGVVKS
ncbi:MAG: glycosyltransferase [Spartobacteria bacterium]|nr:glycosyltransferase [Spartobacteria bacterium]